VLWFHETTLRALRFGRVPAQPDGRSRLTLSTTKGVMPDLAREGLHLLVADDLGQPCKRPRTLTIGLDDDKVPVTVRFEREIARRFRNDGFEDVEPCWVAGEGDYRVRLPVTIQAVAAADWDHPGCADKVN